MPELCELDREMDTFNAKRSELVANSLGKFVLISGDQVEIWDTYDDALHAGYEHFGIDTPFMVRQVKEVETVNLIYRGALSTC